MDVWCVFLYNEEEQCNELYDIFLTQERATECAQEAQGPFAVEYEVIKWRVY